MHITIYKYKKNRTYLSQFKKKYIYYPLVLSLLKYRNVWVFWNKKNSFTKLSFRLVST